MFKDNYTEVTEFILVGLTDRAELQPVLFVVFLVIYLTTVFGNVSMILLIRMLVHFLSERKTISRL
ncbi:hypothetical protein FD755_025522, partial [Muntiacus reevesi]